MKTLRLTQYLQTLGHSPHLPDFAEVSARIASETAARLDPAAGPYISNPHRLYLVASAILATKATRLLEIGAGRGYCTIGSVLIARSFNLDLSVVAIDTIAGDEMQRWGLVGPDGRWRDEPRSLYAVAGKFGCSGAITVLPGYSCRNLRTIEPVHSFPAIFIDGCHSFWNVAYDLTRCFQLLAERGVIVMDDFGGSQGAGTKSVVGLLSRLGSVDVTVIDMEHPPGSPKIEWDHRMAVVCPSAELLEWFDSFRGQTLVGLLRLLANGEVLVNRVKARVATWIRR